MADPVSAPATGNDWVEEGLWQLRLGGLWFVGARALDGEAGQRLRREVLEPFLRPAWWPAARDRQKKPISLWDLVQSLFSSPQSPIDLAEADAIAGHFRARLAEFWDHSRGEWRMLDPNAVEAAFGDNLWDIAAAARARARERKPAAAVAADWAGAAVPRVPVPQAVAYWLEQAGALAAWHRLTRTEDSGRPELAADCQRMRNELARRHQGSGGTFSRVWLQFRSDPELFKQIHDLLGRCEEAFARPTAGPFAELAERVDRHLREAPTWPPHWLARLQAETGDEGLIARIVPPTADDPFPGQSLAPGTAARLLLLRQLIPALEPSLIDRLSRIVPPEHAGTARELIAQARSRSVEYVPPPEMPRRPAPDPEKLALVALDGLAHEGQRPDPAERFDADLASLRTWCEKHGLTVLPRTWRFTAPGETVELSEGESEFIFADAPAGTVVGVRQFGLEKDGRTLRPARLTVSAGRAPAGYQAILDLLAGPTPAERVLRERLTAWPRLQGSSLSLEFEAITLFQDFWENDFAQIHAADPARAQQLTHALEELLHTEYALRRFEPSGWQDPDYRPPEHWMERRCPNGTPQSGRLLRLVRPGLLKDDGQSAPTRALKAIIEVD